MQIVNKIFLAISIIILFGCGSSSNKESDSKLVGSWLLTHPNECQETTTYNANGTWTNIALDEIQTGSYVFTDLPSSDRYSLNITVQADNGLADCDGDSELDTGLSLEVFLSFPTESSMELYLFQNDTTPFYSFTKQQ
tara:strand:+ start:83 stop:496 length:414 start_codon:yes stop_codon:yes gene_type:complete